MNMDVGRAAVSSACIWILTLAAQGQLSLCFWSLQAHSLSCYVASVSSFLSLLFLYCFHTKRSPEVCGFAVYEACHAGGFHLVLYFLSLSPSVSLLPNVWRGVALAFKVS